MSYGKITQTPEELRQALMRQTNNIFKTTAALKVMVGERKTLNTQKER